MTWQELADKYLGKTTEYIDQFAAKLGTTSEYAFEILVKQQVAAGISGIVFFAVVMILSIIGTIISTKMHFRLKTNYEYCDGWLAGIIIGFVIILLALAGLLYNVRLIMNPEYYAIQDIVNFIKEKVGN